MKYFKIEGEFLKTDLHCVINCSHKEFIDYVNKNWGGYDDEPNKEVVGILVDVENPKTKEQRFFLWLDKFDGSVEHIAMLSHELNHFTFRVLGERGVGIASDDNEVFCYYQELFLEKILNKLTNKNMSDHKKGEKTGHQGGKVSKGFKGTGQSKKQHRTIKRGKKS